MIQTINKIHPSTKKAEVMKVIVRFLLTSNRRTLKQPLNASK